MHWPDDDGGVLHAELRVGDAAFVVFTDPGHTPPVRRGDPSGQASASETVGARSYLLPMDEGTGHGTWQRDTIRRHGWALQAVLGDEDGPPFAYTVGLTGFGHAELILFATAQATAATVLNDLGELVRGGRELGAGERVALRNGDVHLLDFPEAEHWLFAADALYRVPGGEPVRALLVVPADELAATPGEDRPCGWCS